MSACGKLACIDFLWLPTVPCHNKQSKLLCCTVLHISGPLFISYAELQFLALLMFGIIGLVEKMSYYISISHLMQAGNNNRARD